MIARRGRPALKVSTVVRLILLTSIIACCCLLLLFARSTATTNSYEQENKGFLIPISDDNKRPEKCRQNIPALIQALRKDPETNGLRPVQSFSGLNQQTIAVFRGKRIALVGDSTLYYFTKWMSVLLNDREFDWKEALDTKDLSVGQELVLQETDKACKSDRDDDARSDHCTSPMGHSPPKPMSLKDGTYLAWAGMSGHHDHMVTEELLAKMWTEVETVIHPEIMIANMGLHWLHFFNMARTTHIEAIRRWIHYEEWVQQVYDKAVGMNVKVLLYKTTNFVCDEKLYDMYLKANTLYMAKDRNTLDQCEHSIQKLDATLSNSSVAAYCTHGTINEAGALYLNARLRKFVDTLPRPSNSMYVDVFNDHDIQMCQYCGAGDGLHYHKSNLMRARLLANQVSCAYTGP